MKPQLFKIELCLMLILAWYGTNSQTPSGQTKLIWPVSYGSYDSDHVYREIDLKTQKKAFEISKGDKIVVNIYPVKKTEIFTSNDVQLKIFFQNIKGTVSGLSDRVDKKKFNEQSANYVSFLKRKKVSGKNVPTTYYFSIDAARIAQADKIAFYLSIKNSHMDYYLMSAKKAPRNPKDSTGKCPPCNLAKRTLLHMDSTGKCPPSCNMQIPIHYQQVKD
jgi:hypothetical protein